MGVYSAELPGRPRPDTAACHELAVLRVIAAMRARLDEELSLKAMADVAIMSPFHFNRTFHNVTGLPPGHFLSALRLERARHLLLTTQQKVTDVCFDVGYNSLGTFTRRFTEMLGVSPRRLRSFAFSPAPVLRPPADSPVTEKADAGGYVSGTVLAPPDFSGFVFVGLFRSSLPHGAPVACQLLHGSGAFTIQAPAGRYHVYALGVRQPANPLGLLMFDDALRASAGAIDVSDATAVASLHLALRPRSDLDPPILVTLPLLAARRSPNAQGRAPTHEHGGPRVNPALRPLPPVSPPAPPRAAYPGRGATASCSLEMRSHLGAPRRTHSAGRATLRSSGWDPNRSRRACVD